MAEEQRIYFRYVPRPWQKEVLAALKLKRLAVIVAHRRAGKTEAMCLRILLAAMFMNRPHPSPLYGYVAPFLNQAKAVAWDRLKFYSRGLPGVKINESELTVTLWNGAVIRIFGADYPDRLRGLGFDGVVMDEVAQMRPETWPDVVRPALSDRKGWAVFIGTPKGQNVFYELYQAALADFEHWYAGMFRADQTGVLPESELAEAGAEVHPKYETPMAQALDSHDGQAILNAIQGLGLLAQVDPTVTDLINAPEAGRKVWVGFGASTAVLRTPEEVAEKQQERAEREREAVMIEQARAAVGGIESLANAESKLQPKGGGNGGVA